MKRILLGVVGILMGSFVSAEGSVPQGEELVTDVERISPVMVETDAGRLAVYDLGGGERTVVLWHSIFTDRTMYRGIIPDLARSYRVVVVEGPGHGASGPQPRGSGIGTHVRALSQIMDLLGITRASIVGTSWGGMVAGRFAAENPERIDGIVLFNTPVFLGERNPPFSNRMIVFGGRLMLRRDVYIRGVAGTFFTDRTQDQNALAMDDFFSHLKNANRRWLMRSVRSVLLTDEPLSSRLGDISVPTLVVAGTDDTYPLEDMRRGSMRIPDSTFVPLETAHISVVDDPAGSLAVLLPFLEGLSE
jgi:3-oxoadipate enol-lactonase